MNFSLRDVAGLLLMLVNLSVLTLNIENAKKLISDPSDTGAEPQHGVLVELTRILLTLIRVRTDSRVLPFVCRCLYLRVCVCVYVSYFRWLGVRALPRAKVEVKISPEYLVLISNFAQTLPQNGHFYHKMTDYSAMGLFFVNFEISTPSRRVKTLIHLGTGVAEVQVRAYLCTCGRVRVFV